MSLRASQTGKMDRYDAIVADEVDCATWMGLTGGLRDETDVEIGRSARGITDPAVCTAPFSPSSHFPLILYTIQQNPSPRNTYPEKEYYALSSFPAPSSCQAPSFMPS